MPGIVRLMCVHYWSVSTLQAINFIPAFKPLFFFKPVPIIGYPLYPFFTVNVPNISFVPSKQRGSFPRVNLQGSLTPRTSGARNFSKSFDFLTFGSRCAEVNTRNANRVTRISRKWVRRGQVMPGQGAQDNQSRPKGPGRQAGQGVQDHQGRPEGPGRQGRDQMMAGAARARGCCPNP